MSWSSFESAIGAKKKIIVIGGGPTVDVVLPTIDLSECAVISTNEAYRDFGSVIHVSCDTHCIEEWYQERFPQEPVWVSRFAFADLPPEGQSGECPHDKRIQYKDIIPAKHLGWMFQHHTGSGPTALMIGWELARRLKCELITVGLDLGCFWKRNGPGQYASHVMREKEKNPVERNKPRWQYNFGPYQTQRRELAKFAEYHREQPDAPKCTSMSAVDWTKLQRVGRLGEALDNDIIARTIAHLDEQEVDEPKKTISEYMKDGYALEDALELQRILDEREAG